jgi:ferredoxin-fold anticodon binding domain-containing protein
MFKNLKLTCNDATTICDKNQYGEASVRELIKLNVHLIRCKICPIYTKHNITLTNFYKGYSQSCKTLKHCMSSEEKEILKIALKQNKE